MANDPKLKDCKHCMTPISRRASICPQCRCAVGTFSGLASFFRTGAWLVTATVSLAFAALEKVDNWEKVKEIAALDSRVQDKQAQLVGMELESEILQEAIIEYAKPQPNLGYASGVGAAAARSPAAEPAPVDGRVVPLEQPLSDRQVERIKLLKQEIDKLLSQPKIDRKEVKRLEREKLELELGLGLRNLR